VINRRTPLVRAANRVLFALVLLNGLTAVHVWTYGFSLSTFHQTARLSVAPGRTILVSMRPQQDYTYYYYPLGMGISEPPPTALLLDLWERNTSRRILNHHAGVTLSLRLITLLPIAATVASLVLLLPVSLLRHQRRRPASNSQRTAL